MPAQVQVSKEPRHKPVLQNEYIRLLDVWLPPGDTTMFHIHSTPSLFVVLKHALTTSQTEDGQWMKDQYAGGKPWYRSFVNDTFVHRVANVDTAAFHVNDIELLAPFDSSDKKNPLSFTLLFENDRAYAYQLTRASLKTELISGRGPMVAELISGQVEFHDVMNKTANTIKTGKYLYIPPNKRFYFSPKGNSEISLILFEIK